MTLSSTGVLQLKIASKHLFIHQKNKIFIQHIHEKLCHLPRTNGPFSWTHHNYTSNLHQTVTLFVKNVYFHLITAVKSLLLCQCCWQFCSELRCQSAMSPTLFSPFVTVPSLKAVGGRTWLLDRHVRLLALKRIQPSPPFVAPSPPESCPVENGRTNKQMLKICCVSVLGQRTVKWEDANSFRRVFKRRSVKKIPSLEIQ